MIYGLFLMFTGLNSVYANNHPVKLGDSIVLVQQQQYGKGNAYIHLHQNETTALRAARAVVRTRGG